MADKTTQSANDIINFMLRNVAPSWGSNANLYLALHTGAVTVGGDQTTNEVAYTGYGRVALARNNSTGVFSTATQHLQVIMLCFSLVIRQRVVFQ